MLRIVLEVKHTWGAKCVAVWNGKPLQPKIVGGTAIIETTLGPSGLGVIAQIRR